MVGPATSAVRGPVPGTRITEDYARLLARDAYFWAWPMANIYNKRLTFAKAPAGLLVTFAKGQLPPVKGFWSLTLYNRHHFFEPNAIKRYSVGTKNKDLQKAADGSLTIHVQADEPKDPVERANWLPSPKNAGFSLYVRAYWPKDAIARGRWTPPAVVKLR